MKNENATIYKELIDRETLGIFVLSLVWAFLTYNFLDCMITVILLLGAAACVTVAILAIRGF